MGCCVEGIPFLLKCIVEDGYKVWQEKKNGFGGTYNDKLYANPTVYFKTQEEAKEAYDFLKEHRCYFTINLPIWGGIRLVEAKLLNWHKLERSSFIGNTSKITLELELLSDDDTTYIIDSDGNYVTYDNKLVRR